MSRSPFVQEARRIILADIQANGVPNVSKKTARCVFLEFVRCGDPDGSNIQCGTASIGAACDVGGESARLLRKWMEKRGYLHVDSPAIYRRGGTKKTVWWHLALPDHPCSLGKCGKEGDSAYPRSMRAILDKPACPRNPEGEEESACPSSELGILDKPSEILDNLLVPRVRLIHPTEPSRGYTWAERLAHSCVA